MSKYAASRPVRRVLAAAPAFAAALVLGLSASPAGAMAPAPESVEEILVTQLQSPGGLEEFWTETFAELGMDFAPLAVYYYDSGTGENYVTECGDTAEAPDNAFYCAADRTIHVDRKYMQELLDEYGDYAVAGVLAHEYGHAVDDILKNEFGANFEAEYHADCLAGMSTRYGYDTGFLDDSDYFEFQNWYLTANSSESHGFAAERMGWYSYGFQSFDLESCDQLVAQ